MPDIWDLAAAWHHTRELYLDFSVSNHVDMQGNCV
jgi:hypothetical protein